MRFDAAEPYFHARGDGRYQPTTHVGGAWSPDEQHVSAPLGLLAHFVQRDHAQRRGDLSVSRLSFDILGVMPLEEVTLSAEVLRPGRTIELVEGTMSHGGRPAVRLRAWFTQPSDTAALEGSTLPPIPPVADHPEWDGTQLWPSGFIASTEIRRISHEAGRGTFWVHSDHPLVEGETVHPLAHATRLFDIANGIATRVSPTEVAFPNIDLTAHYFRNPVGDWIGFDTSVSFGPNGIGLTHSIVHDEAGPFGTVSQSLTVRRR